MFLFFLVENPETRKLEQVENWIIGSWFHVSVHAILYYLKIITGKKHPKIKLQRFRKV